MVCIKTLTPTKKPFEIDVMGMLMLGEGAYRFNSPIWYPVEFAIGDIIGSHDGGIGGGGQGFGLSYPGTFLRTGEVSMDSILRGSAAKWVSEALVLSKNRRVRLAV